MASKAEIIAAALDGSEAAYAVKHKVRATRRSRRRLLLVGSILFILVAFVALVYVLVSNVYAERPHPPELRYTLSQMSSGSIIFVDKRDIVKDKDGKVVIPNFWHDRTPVTVGTPKDRLVLLKKTENAITALVWGSKSFATSKKSGVNYKPIVVVSVIK